MAVLSELGRDPLANGGALPWRPGKTNEGPIPEAHATVHVPTLAGGEASAYAGIGRAAPDRAVSDGARRLGHAEGHGGSHFCSRATSKRAPQDRHPRDVRGRAATGAGQSASLVSRSV